MSRFSYEASKQVVIGCDDFYGVLMAAMRLADTDNLSKLQLMFPAVHAELYARYNAPGGVLEGDREYAEYTGERNRFIDSLADGDTQEDDD